MAEFSVNPSKDIPNNANNSGEDSASADNQSMEDFYEQREWQKTLDSLNPLLPVAQVVGAINYVAQSVFADSPAPVSTPAPAPTPKPTLTKTEIANFAMGGYDMSREFRAAGITNAPTHTNFAKE